MNCKKCNSEVSKDAKFCPNCGEKIEQEISKKNDDKTKEKQDTIENASNETKNTIIKYFSNLGKYKKILIIALIVLIPFVIFIASNVGKNNINSNTSKNVYNFKWDDIVLGKVIPEPETNLGEIISNSENRLSLYAHNTDTTQYETYVDKCKEKGFTTDVEYANRTFKAFNTEGYKLELRYTESEKKMSISLDAPKKFGTFEWVENEYTKLIPKPESNIGEIKKNDEKGFILYVAQMNKDKFKEYTKLCLDKGFKTEPFESEKSYTVKNEEGYKLHINYEGNNVVKIEIDEPEFNVDFEVKCKENIMFSKYDVKIFIDDMSQGTLKHGASETYTKTMKRGSHTIKAVSSEDSSVKGETKINISKAVNVKVELECTNAEVKVTITNEGDIDTKMLNMIEVKGLTLDDANKKLKDLGFTNVKSNSADGSNIFFDSSWQVVNQSVEPNTEIVSNTEIVLTCRKKSEIEKEEKEKAAAQAVTAPAPTEQAKTTDPYEGYTYKDGARDAFEEEIKAQCPFGVKFHWIVGNIAERYEGNGEWFFKVKVTIKNAFGTKYDTTAEGRVDVTNGFNVTYSHIY